MANDVILDLGNEYIGSAYSPVVEITENEDGHTISITSADPDAAGHLVTQSFDVPNYADEEAAREAAEAERQAQEAARQAAEDARKAAETARQGAESSRSSAEAAREIAESIRRGQEQGRAQAEQYRQQNEATRQQAEQARQDAEAARYSAEQARDAAETARQHAESERQLAEQAREDAEDARQAAEQARETASATAVANAEAATSAANTATQQAQAATTAANDAAAAATTAAGTANTAADAADTAREGIQDDLAQMRSDIADKAFVDAYVPLLTAGAANGITGEAADSSEWLQRVSTSDGPTTIHSIHGRTVVWNQRITNGDTERTGAVTGNYMDVRYTNATEGKVAGHKYLFMVHAYADAQYAAQLIMTDNVSETKFFNFTIDTAYVPYAAILTADYSNDHVTFSLRIQTSTGVTELHTKNAMAIDLTAMFGAGNEPSTVAEFEALFPEPYYEYDAGSLLSVNMEGIATEDANGDPIQTRTIDVATYFPNGMRSAGSVYDELTSTEAITRVGVGAILTGTGVVFTAPSGPNSAGIYTHKLDYSAAISLWSESGLGNFARNSYNWADNIESVLGVSEPVSAALATKEGIAFQPTNRVFYYRSKTEITESQLYTLIAQGANSVVYGALATPTVTHIDPPLNLTYRTETGGTERVMVPTGENSAPPTLVTAQGYTAESLRDAALSAIAPVENGFASTNYGIGSYLIHGGQLCRVTVAIASGEAISIGTNVVATTVMAEIMSLIQ